MVFVGIDWSEQHHDVCLLDDQGRVLVQHRIGTGVDGLHRLHALFAEHAEEPGEVTIGIELDRGLLVGALIEAGYRVLKIEPLATARFRERFGSSGGKSDIGDARVLADAVRTDSHQLQPVATNSDLADAVRVIARAHQTAIWDRTRHVQRLRHALREYFPAALDAFDDLDHSDALAVLAAAPTPEQAQRLSRSKIAAALRRGGRQRNIDTRAEQIQTALRTEHPTAPAVVAGAHAAVVSSLVAILASFNDQIDRLSASLAEHFGEHPDTAILLSFPGLGETLGARVLGEFGDDPNRFADANARRNYAGTSPITRASGRQRSIHARFIRNRRLADAIEQWAFASISRSPGCRAFYDKQRAAKKTHRQALRALGNKLVGQLHGALRHRRPYDESHAWRDQPTLAA
ncbi:MAG: IS110 family transposase [Candidatus Competibacterales bacterium]|nr:IS110 family transposase [Candidatus Competibacterales bacterium]